MPLSDLRAKEYLGFNIYTNYKPKRDKTFKPEDCDKFVQEIIRYFKRKLGAAPTLLIIPEEHTGETKLNGITIREGGRPKGHYLLGFDSYEEVRTFHEMRLLELFFMASVGDVPSETGDIVAAGSCHRRQS